MDESAKQRSLALDGVARALSEWTVTRHEEIDGTLAERYGKGWRRSWVVETHNRLKYLGQAIAVRRPRLFAESVARSGSAYEARDVDPADLVANLRCLRETISAQLPEGLARVAVEYVDAAIDRLSLNESDAEPVLDAGVPLGRLGLRYLEAILSGRHREAEQMIVDAVEGGAPVTDVYIEVLQPAQAEIGRMWHEDEISIADEHLASETTATIMSRLRAASRAGTSKGRRVVATAVGGELHALGVRMVADFFEMDGWDAICLGANMPGNEIVRALRDHRPDLLAISVTSFLNVRVAGELIESVRADDEVAGTKILVGGVAFNIVPDLWEEIGADAFAPSAESAVDIGNGLVEPGPGSGTGSAAG